jgi:hypothetical protein
LSGVQGLRERGCSGRTYIEAPHEPIGIAPLGLALDDEGLAADGELVVGTRVGDLARPHLERCSLDVNAVSPKPTMVFGRLAITRAETGSPPAGV